MLSVVSARGAVARRRLDPPRQRGDDRGRDLVLDREDVLEVAVVALGPEVVVGRGVDQLHRDAHPLPDLAHAALDHVLHAELARRTSAPRPAWPLNLNEELREITNSSRKRDSSVMMSSVMPSAKNSCSGSPLMLLNGSTAIDGLSARSRAGPAAPAPSPPRRRGDAGAGSRPGSRSGGSGRRAPARRCS